METFLNLEIFLMPILHQTGVLSLWNRCSASIALYLSPSIMHLPSQPCYFPRFIITALCYHHHASLWRWWVVVGFSQMQHFVPRSKCCQVSDCCLFHGAQLYYIFRLCLSCDRLLPSQLPTDLWLATTSKMSEGCAVWVPILSLQPLVVEALWGVCLSVHLVRLRIHPTFWLNDLLLWLICNYHCSEQMNRLDICVYPKRSHEGQMTKVKWFVSRTALNHTKGTCGINQSK